MKAKRVFLILWLMLIIMSVYHWDLNGFKVDDDDDDGSDDYSAIKINKFSDCSPAFLRYQHNKILELISSDQKFKAIVKKLRSVCRRNTYDAFPV